MKICARNERNQTAILSAFLLVWALSFGTFLFDREEASVAGHYESASTIA